MTRPGEAAPSESRTLLHNAPVPLPSAPCSVPYDEKGNEDDHCRCAALPPTRPRRHAPSGSPRCRSHGGGHAALRLRRGGPARGRPPTPLTFWFPPFRGRGGGGERR